MTGVVRIYNQTLSSNGININSDGLLEINPAKLKEASEEGTIIDSLTELSRFKNALQHKSGSVMINPMEYINKTIISYKNPSRPSSDPYMTSLYSGMMYNSYC